MPNVLTIDADIIHLAALEVLGETQKRRLNRGYRG